MHDKQKLFEDGFWNVNPKYLYIVIFNGFDKATILHIWFLLIMYSFWLFSFLLKKCFTVVLKEELFIEVSFYMV